MKAAAQSLTAVLMLAGAPWCLGESYDLVKVKGIEAFAGSDDAKELLGENGFVSVRMLPANSRMREPVCFC